MTQSCTKTEFDVCEHSRLVLQHVAPLLQVVL